MSIVVENQRQMNRKENSRDSNIELLRIITMLLIVAHHFVVNSELLGDSGPIISDPTSIRSLGLLLLGAWGKIGINCFVIITGFFMCKSSITLKKFLKLVLEWLLYKYLIFFAFLFSGYEPFSIKTFLKACIPIYQIDKNFTSCFIIFWLAIPFLNILISNLKKKQHFYLLLLLSFTYVFFGTIHQVTMNYISWFIVLFFISSYIRLYPMKWMSNNVICGFLLFVSIVLSITSVFCSTYLGVMMGFFKPYFFVTDSNTFLAVSVGLFAFLFFKNLRIPKSKVINIIASSTFGVLLIHANSDTMRQWLWNDLLNVTEHYYDKNVFLYAFSCIVLVFFACVIIDIFRIYIVEKPFFFLIEKIVVNKKETIT